MLNIAKTFLYCKHVIIKVFYFQQLSTSLLFLNLLNLSFTSVMLCKVFCMFCYVFSNIHTHIQQKNADFLVLFVILFVIIFNILLFVFVPDAIAFISK